MSQGGKSVRAGRLLSMMETWRLMYPDGDPNGPKSGRIKARKVFRVIRRIEQRDGARYLHRVGRKWHVSSSALEQLRPWDPGTLVGLRADIDDIRYVQATHNRRLNDHAAFIKKQRSFNRLLALTIKAAREF